MGSVNWGCGSVTRYKDGILSGKGDKDAIFSGFGDEFGCKRRVSLAAINLARFEIIWVLQLWDTENNS